MNGNALRAIAILVVVGVLGTLASCLVKAQTIDVKRLGAEACQCQSDAGVRLSGHTSDLEAIDACADRAFTDGLKKRLVCSYELSVTKPATTPPTPPATYTLPLNWTLPTRRTDGSALAAAELIGYRIYYGTNPANLDQMIVINGANTLSAQLSGLAAGTYYVSLTARTATEESGRTNVLVAIVG